MERANLDKVDMAINLFRLHMRLARLVGYTDRVRELDTAAHSRYSSPATPREAVLALSAEQLLNMSDAEFGDTIDILSADGLKKVMENGPEDD